jgi:hypothetical protein
MWPTLAGDWTGRIERPDGRSQPIFFTIRGDLPRRGRPSIDGRARVCDQSGAVRDFALTGGPDNRRGTRFHISFRPVVDSDVAPGPGDLPGEWNGGDDIHGASTFVSRAPVAIAEASDSSPPQAPPEARYVLRRGNEADFLAACRERTRN